MASLLSSPHPLCPVVCIFRYGLLVFSGMDPFDCSDTVLPLYEAALAPVGMGEMFSCERLMGIPAGGPGFKASGRSPLMCAVEGTGGLLPAAGFNAAGTSLWLTSSKSSSSDWFHSSSLKSESLLCLSSGRRVSSGVLMLKAGDLLVPGGSAAWSGDTGKAGGCSSEGVVGYGGIALESGAGTTSSGSLDFRSTMFGGAGAGSMQSMW